MPMKVPSGHLLERKKWENPMRVASGKVGSQEE
jgi:hypothetical protein